MSQRTYFDELFVEHEGVISLERFMQEALYHPRSGYYRTNICTIGRRGDFSTTPTLHGALGRALAAWALEEKREVLEISPLGRWHVIEIGGGDGSLASDFLKSLHPAHRLRLHYHIVEISEPLRSKQRKRLGRKRVHWHKNVISALERSGGRAIVISNELVDAFPVVAVRWNGMARQWEELFLRDIGHLGIAEEFLPLSDRRRAQLESTVFGGWPPGTPLKHLQRCEVHWGYHQWWRNWLPQLETGTVLTIDYGDEFPTLYHRRPEGTLRAFFQGVQMAGTEVYDRPGHQDITADVNFSDLRAWGSADGLPTLSLTTQRDFLTRFLPGIEEAATPQADPALEFVMSPYGAGDAFKVLWQRRP